MSTNRRDFLQRSATAVAALSIGPLANKAAAAESVANEHLVDANAAPDTPASIKAFENRMFRAHPVPLKNTRVTGGPFKNAQELTGKYLL